MLLEKKLSPGMQRQAIGLVFDYFESIPISPNFGFESNIDWVCRVIDHCSPSFEETSNSNAKFSN